MSRELEGRVALVTGGSRGIGQEISKALAAKGAYVFINYRSGQAEAEATLAACRELGADGELIQFDVADTEAVDAAISTIKKEKGQLDILVNNAGISKDGLFVRLKDEDWDQTLNVNLKGAFRCARAASRLLMKSEAGRVINISSVVGEMGNAGQVPYVSSKAGLIGLTKAMARELASRNVTVNAVAPGFIETEMTAQLPQETQAEHLKAIPLGRYGSAAEVASIVSFLASDGAGYITGQTVGVNGGMYM